MSDDEAAYLLRRAREAGVDYFDTARAYSDSEHKIGVAFGGNTDGIRIATKTAAATAEEFWKDLETSLREMKIECIDVYQFHNPSFVPKPGGADGLYDAMLEAKRKGKIRFIGITNHSVDRAYEAVNSGLYDTLQYPMNHLATGRELKLLDLCREKNVGFIAMKAMSGGLITNAKLPFAFFMRQENTVPIYGVQRPEELEQFLAMEQDPPVLDDALLNEIEKDRRELAGSFCRGCGYCLPCPAGIPINNANRMTQLLQRSPEGNWLTEEWLQNMKKIENCISCGSCASKCPYELKPYETLPGHLEYFRERYKATR